MIQIYAIFHGHEPKSSATAQHPDARRFYVWANGVIALAAVESDAERNVINAQAGEARTLDESAAEAVRVAELAESEARAAAAGLLTEDTEAARVFLSSLTDGARAEYQEKVRVAAELATVAQGKRAAAGELMANAGRAALVMFDDEQRQFLARLSGEQRMEFISATRKQRREIINAAPAPVYVIDGIGDTLTQEEIEAQLTPPAEPTEAERLVGAIEASPAALSALTARIKTELQKSG